MGGCEQGVARCLRVSKACPGCVCGEWPEGPKRRSREADRGCDPCPGELSAGHSGEGSGWGGIEELTRLADGLDDLGLCSNRFLSLECPLAHIHLADGHSCFQCQLFLRKPFQNLYCHLISFCQFLEHRKFGFYPQSA